MRDEREILTRDRIRKKLIRECKGSILLRIVILFIGCILFGLMSLLLFTYSWIDILLIVAWGAFVIAELLVILRDILRISKATRGDFTVVEETLSEVELYELNFWRTLIGLFSRKSGSVFFYKGNYEHIFKFQNGKKFVANYGENQDSHLDIAAQMATHGDKFITVFYNDKPEKIILLYNDKAYNYKA